MDIDMKWHIVVLVIAVVIIGAGLYLVAGIGASPNHNAVTTAKVRNGSTPATSIVPLTTIPVQTTVPVNVVHSFYYVIMPTTVPGMQNENYTISANYTIGISPQGGSVGSYTSGEARLSTNPGARNQTLGRLEAGQGNVVIMLDFSPFTIYTNGVPHEVFTETSDQKTSVQNLYIYSSNKGYNVTVRLNYTGMEMAGYSVNGSEGIFVCMRPQLTTIAGSYFVILTGFNVYTQSNVSRCV